MNISTRNLILINITGLSAVLVVNYLSVTLPLSGKTTAAISDEYPNLFVPAGQTFAIWGVIYLLLIIWAACQFAALFNASVKKALEPALQKIGLIFFSTCLYNIAWLLAFHWEQLLLSVFVMVMLFLRLVRLNYQTKSGFSANNSVEKWLMHVPFGIYWGWISVALIANITTFLVSINWDGFGQPNSFWAVLMIGIGAILAGLVVWSRNNIFYGLAVMWGLFGIYLKQSAMKDDSNAQLVAITAVAGTLAVAIIALIRLRRWLAY